MLTCNPGLVVSIVATPGRCRVCVDMYSGLVVSIVATPGRCRVCVDM